MSAEDQDYKTITTPGQTGKPDTKHQVKIRNYTTGTDEEAIVDLLMGANTTTVESTGQKDSAGKEIQKRVSVVDSSVTMKYNRLLIERFVIDVNGKTDDVVKAVLEMRRPDYKAVLDFLTELTKDIGGLGADEKKD